MKIGILGGTFDPVHLGHLIIAEETLSSLDLDRVIFVPAGDPWMKAGTPITPGPNRLAMVLAAVAGNPAFHVSPVELDRNGPSYTVETLEELQARMSDRWGPIILNFQRWQIPSYTCLSMVTHQSNQQRLSLK